MISNDAAQARGASLAELPAGHQGRLDSSELDASDNEFLRVLGLTPGAGFRVCKQGEPCIVQVHQTRVGLSREIARRLYAVAESREPLSTAIPTLPPTHA